MIETNNSCRFCNNQLQYTFVDLGSSPLANSYLRQDQLNKMEPFYPLHVYICDSCFLVQLPEIESAENIFSNYVYFSSYSESWLRHAENYVDMVTKRFGYTAKSFVVEIASNDGYLLQYFVQRGIPVLGIEPAQNVAEVARDKGIPTLVRFFNTSTVKQLAQENKFADLIIGNNVLAHVPDLNDFVEGMKILLKPEGIITMEFPHLLRLIEENQFDTIYHEHFSYFSFMTVNRIFEKQDLVIFDVEELPTHGGSLRIYVRHRDDTSKPVTENVTELLTRENAKGFRSLAFYQSFHFQVIETKRRILEFFINAKREGKSIVGYGAPAKGNTLLNYCGIRTDFLEYTVDRNPHKQGCYLPGSRIPIYHPDRIKETKPDYVVILPWNLKDEIMQQLSYIRYWNGKFVILIPEVKII